MVTTHLLKEQYMPPSKPGEPPRPSGAMGDVVKVIVPAGAGQGQRIEFTYAGVKVRITLPASARPGHPVMCRLPPMPPRLTPQRSFSKDPRQWFTTFDENHNGRLSRDQLMRALVKTNPRITSNRAHQLIESLGLLEGANNSITLERFLSIHEILQSAVGN